MLPKSRAVPTQTVDQLQRLEQELRERDEKLSALLADRRRSMPNWSAPRGSGGGEEGQHRQPDAHDYSEAETRDFFIDLLLKEAGWALDSHRTANTKSPGCRTTKARASWTTCCGATMAPLGLVEAKRTKRDCPRGTTASEAVCRLFGGAVRAASRHLLLNGYDHWLWDDTNYPPRPCRGSTRRPNSNCWSSDARLASRWRTPHQRRHRGTVLPDARIRRIR